jgi:putative oxidoreductase
VDYYFDKLRPLTLLLLRLTLALIFLHSGYTKYSHGIAGVQQFMVSHGLPSYFAYINVALELGGGVLLILGLGTRIVSLLFAIQMAIAVWSVDMANGVRAIPSYQFTLLLTVASLALMSTGAGSISLDHAFFSGGGRPKARPKG